LGSKVPTKSNEVYTITSPKLEIKIGNFEILPLGQKFDTPLKIFYTAFISTQGISLSSPIDLESENLTLISN
jgi:hypothetical protein